MEAMAMVHLMHFNSMIYLSILRDDLPTLRAKL
jgi:hypothetical protein